MAEVDPLGPDNLSSPAAVGAVDLEAEVPDFAPEREGVGKGPPVGEDFDDLGS